MRSVSKPGADSRRRIAFTVAEDNSTGPLGAMAIVAATCAVLAALQTALWLVVPLILALVLYYLLRPAHLWLTRMGLADGAAAGVVVACFSVAAVGLSFGAAPRLRALALDSDGAVARFRTGGSRLLDQVMAAGDTFLTDFVSVDARDDLKRQIPAFFASLGRIVEPSVASMSKWAPALILIPFFAFFLLKEGREVKALLARPVPNAFFESSLVLLDRIDDAAKAYFRGLFQLTILDAVTLSLGLSFIGLPYAVLLGLVSAVLMWIPYLGGIVAAVCACIVAVTEFSGQPAILYSTLALYLVVRWLDGLVFMPMTIGKNLHIHPVVAVFTILVTGAIAGIPGMMLALPVYGMLKVAYEASGAIILDTRLRARHRHEQVLRRRRAEAGLIRSG
jgi:predicted PurR-regulated permease PerM